MFEAEPQLDKMPVEEAAEEQSSGTGQSGEKTKSKRPNLKVIK
jgi:hypothetical protein